ncbi:hypothetical protein N9Z53_02050 [Mariniblastus sp.]|nr:hypothetical protein [bacterium]MDA7924859.1 hypothetical protein [Mariniblastus sp.]MDA7926167.1 hypothetical protein [Mariniblastus sp.]MDB4372536.1 hypothetical protein [Mariniblastus sp.]
MTNPYESPHVPDSDCSQSSRSFLTRQRVLWIGIGGIVAALMMITISHSMFVESRRQDGAWDNVVLLMDAIAVLIFLFGIIALAVYHWFPDPTRKYSWRRKRARKRENDGL